MNDTVKHAVLPSPENPENTIREYVATDTGMLSHMQVYCKGVTKGTMSTSRFPVSLDDQLCTKMSQFGDKCINPWPRPARIENDFGRFDVGMVDPDL